MAESGNDILLGGAGDGIVAGGSGDDTISGGGGDDRLYGEAGNDTYIFRKGSGNDQVRDSQGNSSVIFSGLNPEDMSVAWSPQYDWNLVFTINDTGETLTVNFGWNDEFTDAGRENYFFFGDGTVWDTAEAMRLFQSPGLPKGMMRFWEVL